MILNGEQFGQLQEKLKPICWVILGAYTDLKPRNANFLFHLMRVLLLIEGTINSWKQLCFEYEYIFEYVPIEYLNMIQLSYSNYKQCAPNINMMMSVL